MSNYILDLLKKHKKKLHIGLGQNFLIDEGVVDKIVEAANIKGKDILEVGPGIGALTRKLIIDSNSVLCYEIDLEAIEILNEEVVSDNLEIIHSDFLKVEIPKPKDKYTIVANIPYYITSDILFKIIRNITYFDKAIIMMQKEVGERILCAVGSKGYGKLALTMNYFADIKKVIGVKSGSFIPAPKVDSIVLEFNFKSVDEEEGKLFTEFVKTCFRQRRKTLNNNLKGTKYYDGYLANREKLEIPDAIRPQNLTLNEFKKLMLAIINK